MKTIKPLILAGLSLSIANSALAQTSPENIFSYSGDSIATNSNYIDPFYWIYEHDPTYAVADYNLTSQNGQYNYQIKLSNYIGTEGDGGYFRVIDILHNNQNILSLKQSNGWDKVIRGWEPYRTTEYYIASPLSPEATAVVFVGYPYNSEPELMTIVILYKGQAKLVLNKNYALSQIVKTDSEFALMIKKTVQEWMTPTIPYNYPPTFKIWKEGSVLKMCQLV